MKWHELTISTRDEAVEAITDLLHGKDADGVSIEESGTLNRKRDTSLGQWYEVPLNDIPEGWSVIKGYFLEGTDMEALTAELNAFIHKLPTFGIEPGAYTIASDIVDEEDWSEAWKQYFKPIRVTERLTIKPTWESYEPEPGERIIELDPGMAFGTGTHPTTALCLRTLDSVVRGGETVIDVGTGSGILAIGAILLGARSVLALDLDPVAVSSARENTRLNGLEAQIQVRLSDLLGVLRQEASEGAADEPLQVTVPVDIVVANILAEIILLFVDDVFRALKPGGVYIASGIYMNKEEPVSQSLEQAGFVIEDRVREDSWYAIVARKPVE